MPFAIPFSLGPFTVGPDGTLSHDSQDRPPSFSFRWRGRLLHAAWQADGAVTIRAVVGRVPSTASDLMADRQRSFQLLRVFRRAQPAGWQLSLLPDHRVVLETTLAAGMPMTANALLTTVTGFLLSLSPYLDLVDEYGMPAGQLAS